MLLNLFKKLLLLLLVFILTPIYALDSYGIKNRSAGAGLVSTNLDDDPRPELISAYIDMPDNNDIIYYKVAHNINDNGDASWSSEKATHINFKMEHLQGLGITIGDINGDDKKDMVFVVMDNPDGENKIRYKIGWSIDSNGDIDYNNVSETIFVNDDNDLKIGDTSDGLGASLWDIDKNGKLDMVIIWSDSNNNNNCNSFGHPIDDKFFAESNTNNGYCLYTNTNSLYGIVLWNLDKDGRYEKISDRFELEGSGKYQVMSGVGVEMTNLDTDPAPELIYSFIDERFNTDANNAYQENKFYHSVGWNMYLEENGAIQFKKTDKSKELTNNGNQNNAGMGIAVAQMDGDHSKELIYTSIDSPIDRDDTIHINIKKNFNKGEALLGEQFNKISTPNRTELITHQGTVISLSLDNEKNSFTYSIMQDDESWSEIQKLTFPDLPSDRSVIDTVKNAPFAYEYKNRDVNTIAFHTYSDGEYLYLFRTDGAFIYMDRFILDMIENRLNAPYDNRYRRSEQKCTPSDDDVDTIGYENMDREPFSEPTLKIWYLRNRNIDIKEFSVELIPTIISGEARWQFFILDLSTQARMHTLSFRKAPRDTCDENRHRVYFQGFLSDKDKDITYTKQDEDGKNTEEEGTKTLHGIIYPQRYSAEELGYVGEHFAHGLNSVSYANQQICEDKLIKREHRIKVILPKYQYDTKKKMLEIDYGVNSFGELSSIDKDIKSSFTDKSCDEESNIQSYKSNLEEVAEAIPFIYDSADGFLHLLYKAHGLQYSMIYDPHKNRWRHQDSSDNQQIKGGWGRWYSDNSYARIPWFYYATPLYTGDRHGYSATAAEYGSYTYDIDGDIVGTLKRAYAFVKPNSNGDGKVNILTEYISELDIKYIGQAKIDSTIVGYIEGAPPVPSENLTNKEKDYSGITSIEMIMADSTAQSYTKARDTGINIHYDGFGAGVGWRLDMSYSWLSEEMIGQESTDTLQMKQEIKGSWSDKEKRWIPDNIGMVAVRGTKADVYGLYLKGNDALFSYKIIPIPNSEEETLTPFVINDNYIKNGSLKGEDGKSSYAKDNELKQIKANTADSENKIKGYYDRSGSSAFRTIERVGAWDEFSKRNIINTYEWSAAGGSRSRSTSYVSQMSDTLGGSFNFVGMVGAGLSGNILSMNYKFLAIAGGHIKRTFKKTDKSSHSFKLSVKANIDNTGVLDAKLSPIEAGKVDYYKWETAYLEPSSDNFNDFFDRVVDRKWLSSSNKFAKELRDARNRPNEAWRIRHFVTFESHTYKEGK